MSNSTDTGMDPNGGAPTDTLPDNSCGGGATYNGSLGLRVGAIFIILVTSLVGTMFPVVAKRVPKLRVPNIAFEFTKNFGAGVIIATAFIHLLSPATDELGSACLTGTWTLYPWAIAIAMMSAFMIFIAELISYRVGIAWLNKHGYVDHDNHGPGVAHGPEQANNHQIGNGQYGQKPLEAANMTEKKDNNGGQVAVIESGAGYNAGQSAAAQIVGVAILEFGVVLHSFFIGLTLATTDGFNVLFIVIIFHQMFEGLGLGTRLAQMPLPRSLNWVAFVGGGFYSLITPLGLAVGLGIRHSYAPDGMTANIVSGILDSIAAGILLYTGFVELLAHQFLFNEEMRKAPNSTVAFAIACTVVGAGIMALLGRWA